MTVFFFLFYFILSNRCTDVCSFLEIFEFNSCEFVFADLRVLRSTEYFEDTDGDFFIFRAQTRDILFNFRDKTRRGMQIAMEISRAYTRLRENLSTITFVDTPVYVYA